MSGRLVNRVLSSWIVLLTVVLVITAGLAVGVWTWQSLLVLERELPKENLPDQGELSSLIQAISRMERAIKGVATSASVVNRNELILSSDDLRSKLIKYKKKHAGPLSTLRPSLEAVKVAIDSSENMQILFNDTRVQHMVRDSLIFALQDLNQSYFATSEESIGEFSAKWEQLHRLRFQLVAFLVLVICFTPALVGMILWQWRTRVLLRKRVEQVEQASRAKNIFLATMSHEIRTPLNGLLGMAQLLVKTDLSSQQKNYVNAIMGAGDHLLVTLNDVLDISRIGTGKLVLEPTEFFIQAVIDTTVAIFKPQAVEKGIDLFCYQDAHLPHVLVGDGSRLRQALFNLVSNAIKFTETGRVTLNFDMEESRQEKVCALCISVWDTGVGIDEEQQSQLFTPFFQGDGSTSRKFGGAGLGLAISRQIAQAMGGSLEFKSTKGEGSVFYLRVTLPLAPQVKEKRQSGGIPAMAILVVEDEPINSEVIKQLLLYEGHRVTVVHSGADALEELKWDSFEVVLMDLRMPEMDGVETARRIREQTEDWRNIPIILLTADLVQSVYSRCQEVGISQVLAKPFGLPHLRRVLSSVAPVAESEELSVQKASLLDDALLEKLFHAMERGTLLNLVAKVVEQGREGRQVLLQGAQPMREWAHKLSGAAAFLGMVGVKQTACRLEQLAKGESDLVGEESWHSLLDQLNQLTDQSQHQVIAQLSAWSKGGLQERKWEENRAKIHPDGKN